MNIKLILVAAVIILAIVLFAVAIPAKKTAEMTGSDIGENAGKAVGWIKGSVDGFTEGKSKGEEAGKAEGLSAKDTKAEIEGAIRQVGVLEVLYADLKMHNITAFGANGEKTTDYSNAKYCALYLHKGVGVFSVDLNKMQVESMGNEIVIKVPEPIVHIEPVGEIEMLAEYGEKNAGSTSSGVIGTANSIVNIYSESEKTLESEDELIEMAKNSAEEQIKMLAENVCDKGKTITVEFFQEGE